MNQKLQAFRIYCDTFGLSRKEVDGAAYAWHPDDPSTHIALVEGQWERDPYAFTFLRDRKFGASHATLDEVLDAVAVDTPLHYTLERFPHRYTRSR